MGLRADLEQWLVPQGNALIHGAVTRRFQLGRPLGERAVERRQAPFQPAELSDSTAKLRQLLSDQGLQVGPRRPATALVDGLHQFTDLVKGKVEEARLSDELESPEIILAEQPVPSRSVPVLRALRGWQQAR